MKLLKIMYLAMSFALFSSCNNEKEKKEIKREDYNNMPGSLINYNEVGAVTKYLFDMSGNGNVDLIKEGNLLHPNDRIVSICPKLYESGMYRGRIHNTFYLTPEIRDRANEIRKMQQDLEFLLDSTFHNTDSLISWEKPGYYSKNN